MVQQIHLQNGLVLTHGLGDDVLGADHLEISLLADVELLRNDGREGVLTQALGQAGLVLADLADNGGAGGVHCAAHIAVAGLLLGAEDGSSAADGDLDDAAMPLFYREGHKRVGVLPEIAVQLGDLFLGILLDGFVEGHLFAGKCELHKIAPFNPSVGDGCIIPVSLPLVQDYFCIFAKKVQMLPGRPSGCRAGCSAVPNDGPGPPSAQSGGHRTVQPTP